MSYLAILVKKFTLFPIFFNNEIFIYIYEAIIFLRNLILNYYNKARDIYEFKIIINISSHLNSFQYFPLTYYLII